MGAPLRLVCHVGANPLAQSSIVQIEWLHDGRRLAGEPRGGQAGNRSLALLAAPPTPQQGLHIERANHLHMAGQALLGSAAAAEAQLQVGQSGLDAQELARSLRLQASSVLTISSLQRSHAGSYSCQFKLIPTPAAVGQPGGSSGGGGGLLGAPNGAQRITSGQASQRIQVELGEGEFACNAFLAIQFAADS